MTYLPYIDGLRAVAILAVVAFHALPHLAPGGFVGVDVFFVISGFLITRFIVEEMHEGSWSIVQFYVRRARRLMPAAVVMFVAVAVLSSIVLLPDAFWYFGRSLLGAMLMYANVFFYRTGGYFSAPAIEKPLLHTWSLAVEDQFYLTWPLLLLLLWPRLSRRAIAGVVLAIAAASLAYAQWKVQSDSEFAFFMLPTRAWELLIGALVALSGLRRPINQILAEMLAGAGLAAVVASIWILNGDADFPGLAAAPACFGTVAIVVAGLNQPTTVGRFLSLKPMVFVGLISYSLYLWHWPLIALATYRLEHPLQPLEAAAVVALSFVLAVLSWRFVEQPFRKRHNRHLAMAPSSSDKVFVVQALAAVVLVVGIAAALKIGKGFPQRYHAQVRTVLSQMVTGNPVRSECDNYENIFRNDDVCNLGARRSAGESYDIALFGDSMSDHWTPLVAQFAEEKELSFRQVTNGGCALFFGVTIPARPEAKARECASYQGAALKFLQANPNLKLAVISGYWSKWEERIDGRDLAFPEFVNEAAGETQRDAFANFDEVLRQTVETFTQKGIKVLLIGQIPVYEPLPVRCVVGRIDHGEDTARCGLSKEAATSQLGQTDMLLKRVAARDPLVSVWLPFDALCQEQYCSLMSGGTFLYKNGTHVNAFGSKELRRFVSFPTLR